MLRTIYLVMSLTFFSTSCATLSKEECLKGDWTSVGRADGRQGYTLSRFEEHQTACTEYQVQPNYEAYQTGRLEGLQEYCTTANGFDLGNQAKKYENVCPPELEAAFLDGYTEGLTNALRTMEQQLYTAEDKRNEKERQLSYTNDDKERDKLRAEIKTMDAEVTRLTNSRLDILGMRQKIRSLLRPFEQ